MVVESVCLFIQQAFLECFFEALELQPRTKTQAPLPLTELTFWFMGCEIGQRRSRTASSASCETAVKLLHQSMLLFPYLSLGLRRGPTHGGFGSLNLCPKLRNVCGI